MTARAVLAALALAASTACSNSPTSPTTSAEVPDPITTPVTVTYPGVLGAGGTASRTFTAQIAGTARATVSGITPATPLVIGLGIPRADGGGCLLARSATAADGSSATVSANVDVGTFCAQVLAPAALAGTVGFTVTLEHP